VRAAPSSGQSTQLSPSELDPLRARLTQLWTIPAGAKDPQELIVQVRVKLKPDGMLATPPMVLTNGKSPLFVAARDSAIRALFRGQPYDMLKPEHYEQWKEIEITFDPRDKAKGIAPVAPVAPVAPSPATVSRSFVVAIKASVSGGARPIVTGTTNLPDGTTLSIFLRLVDAKLSDTALSACGDICSGAGLHSRIGGVVVKNGQFSDGPFTPKGAALPSGTYVLEVTALVKVGCQSPDVLAILGARGENLTAPLVGACCFAPGRRETHIQETRDIVRDRSTGTQVYYARYVQIGPD
jgi:hypothetical protein